MRRALCIAYHFPPIRVSSGIQRTLKFATYLRDHQWESMILSAHPRAYEFTSPEQLDEIPKGMIVSRAFALDTARHLSLRGRYPEWLALPDRYWTWAIGGFVNGLSLVRRHRPDVIWSTYPVATAHVIGALLHRATGIPWVADFRDSMTEEGYPEDPQRWRAYRRIERHAVANAQTCVFTTQGTRALYSSRYPDVPPDHWVVIPNGYDEENFAAAASNAKMEPLGDRPIRLVHSGTLYPSERDPTQFFEAIKDLKMRGMIGRETLRVILRATGHDAQFRPQLQKLDIEDIVELHPGVGYRDALTEMLCADGLLLFQATNSNHQVPAKLYEYVRAGRPILALTDPVGDTAKELNTIGVGTIAPLDSAQAISSAMSRFVHDIRNGTAAGATRQQALQYSRAAGAAKLAGVLNAAIGERH